jgi:hypothetical protein
MSGKSKQQETGLFTVTYVGACECRTLRGAEVVELAVKAFVSISSSSSDAGQTGAASQVPVTNGQVSLRSPGAKTVVLAVGPKELCLTELITKKNNKVSYRFCTLHVFNVLPDL